MLAIRLPAEIETRLATLAKKTSCTKTYYATQAILEKLEDLEDYYLAEAAYREFVESGEQAVPWSLVKQDLENDASG